MLGFDPLLFAFPKECRVAWAHNAVRPHQRIPAQSRTMALGRLAGADELVSTGPGGSVSVWSARGSPRITFQAGDCGAVTAIAVGSLGRDDVIVTGGYDQAIRVHDDADNVTTVAVGRLSERDVIVSGGWDGRVIVWDGSGEVLAGPLAGHSDAVTTVAVGRLLNRDVIVSASVDTKIQVWDEAGRPLGEPLTGHLGAWPQLWNRSRVADRRRVVLGRDSPAAGVGAGVAASGPGAPGTWLKLVRYGRRKGNGQVSHRSVLAQM